MKKVFQWIFFNTHLSILSRRHTSNEAKKKRESCMVWWMLICALVLCSCDMVDIISYNRMVVWWLIFTLALTCNATSQALSLTCNVSSQIDVVHLALKHKHYNSMVKFIKTAPDIFLQEIQSILDWKRNPNIHHF